jgi:hypothetical protein
MDEFGEPAMRREASPPNRRNCARQLKQEFATGALRDLARPFRLFVDLHHRDLSSQWQFKMHQTEKFFFGLK